MASTASCTLMFFYVNTHVRVGYYQHLYFLLQSELDDMDEKKKEEKKESTDGPSSNIMLSRMEVIVQFIFQEGSLVKEFVKLSPDLDVSGMKAVMIEFFKMLQEGSLAKELSNLSPYLMYRTKALIQMDDMFKNGSITSAMLMAAIKEMASSQPSSEIIKKYIRTNAMKV